MARSSALEPEAERVRALHGSCQGNLVRVHEELVAEGYQGAYSSLTAFCRRYGIGQKTKVRAGTWDFAPGLEMQHDTSPHDVLVGGRKLKLQCASMVLAYSRRLYARCYVRFNRFAARAFLTRGVLDFGGAPQRCVVDNTSVIVAAGTGPRAVIAPEMEAFAARFGFAFMAHAVGHADRSARVERPFHYIEHNFYPGRAFADLADLNVQLEAWCEAVNGRLKRSLGASPTELFAAEKPHLGPLPLHVPEVYDLHHRTVDLRGYVHLDNNRYSVPDACIGHRLEVFEYEEVVRIFRGHAKLAEHPRLEPGLGRHSTLPEHAHPARRRGSNSPQPTLPEEARLRALGPSVDAFVDALKRSKRGRAARPILALHRLYLDYPTEPFCSAVKVALDFGLTDLGRLERLILQHVAGDFFRLPIHDPSEDPDER